MPTDPQIGLKIRRARERRRWSQAELAARLNVSQKTVDNWENERTRPKSAIGAIEDLLGPLDDPVEGAATDDLIRLEATFKATIEADPHLNDADRQSLMHAYRAFRDKGR